MIPLLVVEEQLDSPYRVLFYRVNNPLHPVLQLLNHLVGLCWTHFNLSMSLVLRNPKLDTVLKCNLINAEQMERITSLILLATLLLI